MSVLPIVEVRRAELGKEKHRQNEVNGREHHLVYHCLDLLGGRCPRSLNRPGHIAGSGCKGRGAEQETEEQSHAENGCESFCFH